MGVPYVQAPSEGEAQAAAMNRRGDAWAPGSQDWDLLLFGADRMVRNLTTTGKRKVQGKEEYREVVPEMVDADRVLADLEVTREELVWLGMMIGTDYNPGGIEGIGPKRGMDLVQEHDTFEDLMADEKWVWEHESDPAVVRDFFMNPPVDPDVAFEFGSVDRDAVVEVLVERHDFSRDRVDAKPDDLEAAQAERNAASKQVGEAR
ncbi:MAG: flap structure-specific endonuclease, partial [Candidatus Nanohaloarchaea archaeon]